MPNGLSVIFGADQSPPEPRTRVRVKRFGRIQAADVELAPLTILVGRNNTGKSYLASLLWGVRSGALGLKPYNSAVSLPAPAWFTEYVRSAHEAKLPPLQINGRKVSDYVNEWLKRNKALLISDLLSLEGLDVDELEIELSGNLWLSPQDKAPSWAGIEHFREFNMESWAFSWNREDVVANSGGMITGNLEGSADTLFRMAVEKLVSHSIGAYFNNAAYIPAARTGLILALGELTSGLVGSLGLRKEGAGSRFSKPMIRFLQNVIRETETQKTAAAEVADFLQNAVLSGKIEVNGTGLPTFLYKPEGSETQLPMHAVSSMITELTPLLSLLRCSHFDSMVIEEPEAHLHLSAQRSMARAIVRLVNKGIPVVVTTHSDTFLQQINLSIQLYHSSQRASLLMKLGYTDEDVLRPEDVIGYEFTERGGATSVEQIEIGEEGLVARSLNETLIGLAEDVLSVARA